MIGRLIAYSARHPWPVVLAILIATVAAATQLGKLRFSISAEGMMVSDSARSFFERTVETFGSDNATIVVVADPHLFDRDKLRAVGKAVRALEALPFVSRTESLFSVRDIKTVNGYVTMAPYLAKLPGSKEEADRIKHEALINPLIEGNLLSRDGTAVAINVYLKADTHDAAFDLEAARQIGEAIAPLKAKLKTVFHLGLPGVRAAITDRINEDQRLILPLCLGVLVLSLAFSLRKAAAIVIPMLTAGLSVVWTLGLMAVLDVPINVMTALVPALLIIIGSTEDIHLVAEYHAGIARGLNRRAAIQFMADNMGTAVFLTFVTTYLGFLSIAINRLDLLQTFGLVASTGLLLNFLITILLVPVCLRAFGQRPQRGRASGGSDLYQRLAGHLLHDVLRYRKVILMGTAVVVACCGAGASLLRVNNNTMDYFRKDEPIVMRSELLHEKLAGTGVLSIVVTGTEGTFLRVSYLQELQKLQKHLANTGQFDKSVSFADFMAVMHSGIDAEFPGTVYLPATNDIVREYMNLVSRDVAAPFVSPDYSQARILVRHNIGSSYELNKAVEGIKALVAKSIDPGLDVRVTGEAYLNSLATDYMASGQAQSLALMVAVIFLIISLLFLNMKAGLLAVLTNLFPVTVLFGVMGYAGIPLDTGTVMIGAISLGICVDHTMHFMVRYHRGTRDHGDTIRALDDSMRHEVVPIVATASALAMGFGTMAFSHFPPVAHFGLLSAMVMLLALISTFVITPALLSFTRLITVWDMLTLDLKGQVVERCPLFREMRPSQIRKTVLLSDVQEYAPGELIVRQGEAASELYVLLEGSAEVWQSRSDGSRYLLTSLSAGGVLGEIALVSDTRRIADVITAEPTKTLSLAWRDIQRIARHYPRISSQLFHNLSSIVGERLASYEMRETAFKDELTGAFNRPYFSGMLQFAVDHANRYDQPLSLLVLRVDGYQHLDAGRRRAGDALLKAMTAEIARQTRRVDVFARWGGEMFAILLPNTMLEHGELIGERLRNAVESHELGRASGVSISAGVTEYRDGEPLAVLIQRAENALRSAAEGASNSIVHVP